MAIYESMAELIGNTPLLHLGGYEQRHGLGARLLGKVEFFNPAGSVKDRVAREMLDAAERAGKIGPGAVIIEPTSGNTGIGLAAIAATRGMRAIIVMPDSMSVERQRLMKAFGAEVVLTPGAKGMAGAIERAGELAAETSGSFIPSQFSNSDNPAAHYKTTGPEIWRDTEGAVDILVAGVGTGGTITGTGRYLKERNPAVRVVAVEPATSAVLSGGAAGPHGLQGIGAGFIPEALDTSVYDEVLPIADEEAFAAGCELAAKDGLLVGITSGAAVAAAAKLAARPENAGKTIVAILPDTGERYLTTAMFA